MNTSIFKFDHGQKKLTKAVGISPEYLNDLQETVKKILFKTHERYADENIDDDCKGWSPSELVESALAEFSYSQLVLLSSFYLGDKVEQIQRKAMSKFMSSEHGDMPQGLKDIIDKIRRSIDDSEQED